MRDCVTPNESVAASSHARRIDRTSWALRIAVVLACAAFWVAAALWFF